jgi:acyl-CoA synthetase (AMP-forming)/AMP-acid ligase II
MKAPTLPAQNLTEVVQLHAANKPHDLAYTFLVDGEDQVQTITFGELDRQSRLFAAALRQLADPGDRALLLYPSGLEFITAFLGCLYAGVIAVPITTPHPKRDVPRLRVVLGDAGATVACGMAKLLDQIPAALQEYPEFGHLRWLAHERIPSNAADGWKQPAIRSTDLAFLQYTSGSTSAPKGVMLSHANLLYGIMDCQLGSAHGPDSRMVMWLPAFHDMGLIYGLLTPLTSGAMCTFMAPVAFLERPYRWLRAITKYRGTDTAAPNFAYELCVHKVTPEERETLDLSSLVVAVNAAEPVRLSTINAFAERFEPQGFNRDVFCPSYGLAESVVEVTNRMRRIGDRMTYEELSVAWLDTDAIKKDRLVFVPDGTPGAQPSVGCGSSNIGADIRIVDPNALTECPPDAVGEIWISSPSVAQGYWNRPDETKATFGARLAPSGLGPFLRTGDLGFLRNGQLHITGRIKDMVIVSGRNYYPQDIEISVQEAHPALQVDSGAVFAVEDETGAERLVVVQEVKREFRRSPELVNVANAIRMAVARNHGLRPDAVILVMPGRVPKTTSGKIQRHAARRAFERADLEPLYEWHAPRR